MVDVLLVRARIVEDAVGTDLHDPGGELADEPPVVGDEDEGAVELLQPFQQRLDGLQVQMVRGLVQHQHVGALQGQATEDQAYRLPARQGAQALLAVVPAEEDETHVTPDESPILTGAEVPEPLLGGLVRVVELLVMVLGEVARMGLVAPLHRPGVGFQLPHDDLQQGRLSDAVRAEDGQTIAPVHREVDPVEHLVARGGAVAVLGPERLPDPPHLQHFLAAGPALLEAEGGIAP